MGFWKTLGNLIPPIGIVSDIVQGSANRRQQRQNLARQIDWSRESQQIQNSFNREMWQLNNEQNEKFWHMSNMYNSPQQQMARLKAAGLNPNMIYGSAQSTGGTSSPVRSNKVESASRPTPDFQSVKAFQMPNLGTYANIAVKQAQKDSIEAQTEYMRQRTATEAVNTALKADEKSSSRGYFAQRRQKMAQDAEISRQKTQLGRYSTEVAMEKLQQVQIETKKRAAEADLTTAKVVAQEIQNEYEGKGLSPNTPYHAKMLYKRLKAERIPEKEIANILLMAGIGSEVLKYVLPAGVLKGVLRKAGSPKGKKPRYNSPGNWSDLDRRLTQITNE